MDRVWQTDDTSNPFRSLPKIKVELKRWKTKKKPGGTLIASVDISCFRGFTCWASYSKSWISEVLGHNLYPEMFLWPLFHSMFCRTKIMTQKSHRFLSPLIFITPMFILVTALRVLSKSDIQKKQILISTFIFHNFFFF